MPENSIKIKIQQDQITFMKSGKKEESNILRFALSFINKEEKDKNKILNNPEIIQVLKKVIKRNSEAYDQYMKAKRDDLAKKEPFATFSKFYQSGILGADLQQKYVGLSGNVFSIHNFHRMAYCR